MLLLAFALACGPDLLHQGPPEDFDTWAIPPAPQREGDADAGLQYLLYGDYVGSGVPLETWSALVPPIQGNPLDRDGASATVPYSFNVFEAPNGVEVVGGINCFGCHAGRLEGELVVGLGNPFSDFTSSDLDTFELSALAVENTFGLESPEWAAYEPLIRGARASADAIVTPFAGVNPAFTLEEAAAAHRRPGDLSWSTQPLYDKPTSGLASDVPAWWNVGKKPALYYNGMGRGDAARLLMQISVVGLTDLAQAERIDARMPDVLAFLRTLEPPVWPGGRDAEAAARGEAVFLDRCARCHGTYGEGSEYPGLLVALAAVGTDPAYAMRPMENELTPWYNASWFAADGESAIVPFPGYVAPPLNGIWASAPYFHNGSVPTLAGVLDPEQRPERWARTGAYDRVAVGLAFEVEAEDPLAVYDTRIEGYGNGGHAFAADLDEAARADLIAYLVGL